MEKIEDEAASFILPSDHLISLRRDQGTSALPEVSRLRLRVGEAWVELLKNKETPVTDLAALVKVDGIGSGSRGTGLGYIGRALAERDPAEANQLVAALPSRQDQLKLATALVIETNPDKSIAFGDQLADAGVRDAYFERAARSYALDSQDAAGNPLLAHISDPVLRQKTEAGIRETLKALEEQR